MQHPLARAVQQRVKDRLPERAVYELRRRLRPLAPRPIDLGLLDELHAAEADGRIDHALLRDPARLPALIRELGLNDHHPHIMPPATHYWLGRGLRMEQSPHQFASYLVFLADRDIRSYVEIGTAHGGTFAATICYLELTGHHIEQAVAVDPQYAPGLVALARRHPAVSFVRDFSTTPAVRALLTSRAWDLVLIDGDHTYEGVRADYETIDDAGTHIIAFHDIVDAGCPGVRRLWKEICERDGDRFEFVEFVQQYEEVTAWTGSTHYGIGVAVRR